MSIWERTAASIHGKVGISYRRGGGWKRIGTAEADRNGIFRSVIKTRLARKVGVRRRATLGPGTGANRRDPSRYARSGIGTSRLSVEFTELKAGTPVAAVAPVPPPVVTNRRRSVKPRARHRPLVGPSSVNPT